MPWLRRWALLAATWGSSRSRQGRPTAVAIRATMGELAAHAAQYAAWAATSEISGMPKPPRPVGSHSRAAWCG
eukprot:686176-Lingulodinium_polyedra.AAC.1